MKPAVVEGLLAFGHALRLRGWPVGIEEQHDALRIARHVGIKDPGRLCRALRPLYCGTPDQWREFEALFRAHWHPLRIMQGSSVSAGGAGSAAAPAPRSEGGDEQPERADGNGNGESSAERQRRGASRTHSLARTDFRHLHDAAESAALDALMERMARRWQHRLRRRWRTVRKGTRLSLRRTLRRSVSQGGAPLQPVWLRPRRHPPSLVLLVDASRSMNPYSFRFLRFAAGALGAFPGSEAFIFHTRLVRITDALRDSSAAGMRQKLNLLSEGWSGGTRIGASIADFNRLHGEAVRRRSVVIILSDGLDTGEPQTLTSALAELRRRAGRLVWLNPLMGRPGYAPQARAMRAALPYLDQLHPAHTLQSLLELADTLRRL